MFAVVTGGGTAGHVLPALAVAEALVAAGHPPAEIHYIGARRGIETRLLADTPYPATFLDVVGFQRRHTRANVWFVPKMIAAARQARRLLAEDRPAVVVSVGGYASMPAVLAARRLDVPIVVVSYDSTPGRASRLQARWAAVAAVAFPDSGLPRARLTGAPVRRQVLDVDRARDRAMARAALGLPEDRFVVAVAGGSLGSGVLNDAVSRYVDDHAADAALAVHHIVGERFMAGAMPARDGRGGILYRVIGYEDRMALVYAAADVFVGRGGASTVSEVAATGTPAILVPWAASADDHQSANVRWLADPDAAVLVPEDSLASGALSTEIERLRADVAGRAALGEAAHRLGEMHRRGRLAEVIEEAAAR